MQKIITKIESLPLKIKNLAQARMLEFEKVLDFDDDQLFVELCFCIIVANNSISNALRAYNFIGKEFLILDEQNLKQRLKITARRFYNKRAEYIIDARKKKDEFLQKIHEFRKIVHSTQYTVHSRDKNILGTEYWELSTDLREWLVKNIKGFGYKEASHFLRNVGGKDFAILDRHILKFLFKENIINEVPKSLNKKKYIEIENILIKIAEKLNISMTLLDIYIFYIDSGRICEK